LLQEKQLDLFQGTSYERPELKYKNYWPITPEEIEDLLFELRVRIDEYVTPDSKDFNKQVQSMILGIMKRGNIQPSVEITD
jgi:hypothetical protein